MNKLIKIFKGATVGLGSILPGISGGMIAAVFNIYEKLILAISNLAKTPVKALLSIWEYLVGIVFGIALGIVLIATIFKLYPIPITMLFIGFILGGIPSIMKEVDGVKKNWYHYIISITMALIMIGIIFIKPNNVDMLTSWRAYLLYASMGFLIALPIVVPGVSGTMILMTVGLFDYMTNILSDFIKAILTFNGSGILSGLMPFLTIAISGLLGLILFSKFIYYLLKNHKLGFNMAILGILFIAPVNILVTLYKDNDNLFERIGIVNVLVSIVLLTIGVVLAYKVSKMEHKERVVDAN